MRARGPLEGVERLLVRVPNWVGDALLATPALHALRASLPGAEIALLAKPWVAPLFEASPDCDRLILYERPGRHAHLSGLRLLCRELRAAQFEAAVLFQNAFEAALIARLAGVARRAGYATDGRRLLLSHPVSLGGARGLHHADYYLNLVAHLGCQPVERRLRLALPTWAEEAAVRRLEALELSDKPLLGVAPGAAFGTAKRWPPERFARVADELAQRFGFTTLIFGSRGEQEVARRVAQAMKSRAVDLSGRTELLGAAAALSRCRLFLTNDSGLMHLASALNVPLVAVFGPTDWKTTSPLGERSRLVRAHTPCAPCLKRHCPTDHRCMLAVSAGEVLECALRLLEETA